jgi:hypothetical protein
LLLKVGMDSDAEGPVGNGALLDDLMTAIVAELAARKARLPAASRANCNAFRLAFCIRV